MGVNPVTGGDGAMLIKEIKDGRWKARHDSPTSTPPLQFPRLCLCSSWQQQAARGLPVPALAPACSQPGKGSCQGCLRAWVPAFAGRGLPEESPVPAAAAAGSSLGRRAAQAG